MGVSACQTLFAAERVLELNLQGCTAAAPHFFTRACSAYPALHLFRASCCMNSCSGSNQVSILLSAVCSSVAWSRCLGKSKNRVTVMFSWAITIFWSRPVVVSLSVNPDQPSPCPHDFVDLCCRLKAACALIPFIILSLMFF